jgi:SAM-dependent methyltransferase
MKLKKSILWISGIVIAAIIIISLLYSVNNHVSEAENILDKTGVKGGLIIHAGTTNGKLTTALYTNDRYLVQGLARDENSVKKARNYIKEKGLYGKVTVDHWNGKKLPYAGNMVNLFVACQSDLGEITGEEINRVLAPKGVAYIRKNGKWDKWIKPWPDDIDEWTHYMYNSQGDFRSKDKKVGLPRGIQWDSALETGTSELVQSSLSIEERTGMDAPETCGGWK